MPHSAPVPNLRGRNRRRVALIGGSGRVRAGGAVLLVAAAMVIFLTAGAAQSAQHRRTVVGAGGGSAGDSHCVKHFPPMIRDGFPEPQMRFSSAGRLDTTLRMANTPVTIAGHRYVTMAYE